MRPVRPEAAPGAPSGWASAGDEAAAEGNVPQNMTGTFRIRRCTDEKGKLQAASFF